MDGGAKQADKFCRCVKSVRKTLKARKGSTKEQGAIGVCVKSVLQTKGRTVKKFKCGKKPRLTTQKMKKRGGGDDDYEVVWRPAPAVQRPFFSNGEYVRVPKAKPEPPKPAETVHIGDVGKPPVYTGSPDKAANWLYDTAPAHTTAAATLVPMERSPKSFAQFVSKRGGATSGEGTDAKFWVNSWLELKDAFSDAEFDDPREDENELARIREQGVNEVNSNYEAITQMLQQYRVPMPPLRSEIRSVQDERGAFAGIFMAAVTMHDRRIAHAFFNTLVANEPARVAELQALTQRVRPAGDPLHAAWIRRQVEDTMAQLRNPGRA
jgi:hypothetical protein